MNYPFPGMDPYLEHRILWPGVHNRLIVALANQIQPRILPRYLASIEQRVFVEGPDREVIPDIHVRRRPGDPPPLSPSPSVDSPVVLAVNDLEVHESYIQILDRHAQMRVVTVIEVVSPSNKQSRNGRRSYLAKQRETLDSDQHLVEIDLLRRGRHVLSVPSWRAADLARTTTSCASIAPRNATSSSCIPAPCATACRVPAFPCSSGPGCVPRHSGGSRANLSGGSVRRAVALQRARCAAAGRCEPAMGEPAARGVPGGATGPLSAAGSRQRRRRLTGQTLWFHAVALSAGGSTAW